MFLRRLFGYGRNETGLRPARRSPTLVVNATAVSPSCPIGRFLPHGGLSRVDSVVPCQCAPRCDTIHKMTEPHLLSEQTELLDTLIGAYRSHLPKREKFWVAQTFGGDTLVHPGLPGGEVSVYFGDVEALADAGLLRLSYGTSGTPQFDVTPAGFRLHAGRNEAAPAEAGLSTPMPQSGAPEPAMRWVLVASPSDVAAERAAAVEAMERWNSSMGRHLRIVLAPLRWEIAATPEFGIDPQAAIDRQLVDNADLLVGLFGGRLGNPTADAPSGTVHEINRFAGQGKPVLLYFREGEPDNTRDDTQVRALDAFRRSLAPTALYRTFRTSEGLQAVLLQDFTNCLAPPPSTTVTAQANSEHGGEVLIEARDDEQGWAHLYVKNLSAETEFKVEVQRLGGTGQVEHAYPASWREDGSEWRRLSHGESATANIACDVTGAGSDTIAGEAGTAMSMEKAFQLAKAQLGADARGASIVSFFSANPKSLGHFDRVLPWGREIECHVSVLARGRKAVEKNLKLTLMPDGHLRFSSADDPPVGSARPVQQDDVQWWEIAGAPTLELRPDLDNRDGPRLFGTLTVRAEPMVGALKVFVSTSGRDPIEATLMQENASRPPALMKYQFKPMPVAPGEHGGQPLVEVSATFVWGSRHTAVWSFPLRHHEKGHWALDTHLGTPLGKPALS